jgi:hypothetical protein
VPAPYIWAMTKPTCEKCGRRNLVTYQVEPKDAWLAVVPGRWKSICPSCFDAEAALTGVRYQFIWYASDIVK